MGFKKHIKSAVCLLLTVMMIFSVMLCVSAAEEEIAQTGTGETVYFRNTQNWSTVNAYMWKDGNGNNGEWPGKAMTKVEDNVYKYEVTGDFNMIIFNNGSTQTADLNFAGDGQIFDYSTNSWSAYDGHVVTPTTTPVPTDAPTTAPTTEPDPSSKVVFCKNSAGWSSVYCYMWKDGAGNNGDWPGKLMTNIGEDIWQYEISGNWDMIIFNGGSDSAKTGDMSFPGTGRIYDNKTNAWDVFDTSPITVKSTGTDLASPQYKGTDIKLSAQATSTAGTVYYKFSVTNGSKTTVLSDFSTANSVLWTPTVAGTYTLTYEFKDAKNNENKRTATYTVSDDSNIAEPILKGVSPKPGQIKKGTKQNLSISAGGGKTGTNLLFYKVQVLGPSETLVNVPYYTKTASYSFTPSVLGKYTVIVSVQASDNETIERKFVYDCVNEVSNDPTDAPTNAPTDAPTTGTYLKGDASRDGKVTVADATFVQRFVASIIDQTGLSMENAEVSGDGKITIADATLIQRFIAGLEPNW